MLKQFTATVLGSTPDNITLHMSPSEDNFFLTQITMDRNSGVSGFVGTWAPGSPKHASRSVEVDDEDFSRLHNECAQDATVQVTLTYHLDGIQCVVENIDCAQVTVQPLYAVATSSAECR